MNNKTYGSIGEAKAENYLKQIGYTIIERNFSNLLGEIDLICKDGNTIVFVEVKARFSKKFGMPREAVTTTKQRQVRKVAMSYLKYKKLFDLQCRFDVVEVLGDEVTHITNCF